MAQAFALREDHTGEITAPGDDGQDVTRPLFQGATATLSDGTLFDIGAALDANDGVIATDEPELIRVLDESPALKHVAVPDGANLVVSYDSRTVAALRDLPAARAIVGVGSMSKDELVARLRRADAGEDPNAPLEQPAQAEEEPAPAPRARGSRKTPNAPEAPPVAPAEGAAATNPTPQQEG